MKFVYLKISRPLLHLLSGCSEHLKRLLADESRRDAIAGRALK
jgi:hypothetical protein